MIGLFGGLSAAIASFGAGVAAVPAMTVQGDSVCPRPADVAERLPGLLGPAAAAPPGTSPDLVSVDALASDLIITVRDPEGGLRLTRHLARTAEDPGACHALAEAAAVVIATWRMERSAPPPLAFAAPPESPSPAVVTTIAAPIVDSRSSNRASNRPWTALPVLAIGVGIGSSLNRAGFAGTGQLQLLARWRRFGVSLALAADTARDDAVEGGTTTWRRLSAGIGPYVAWLDGPVGLETSARLLLGRTSVDGRGYDTDHTDHALTPGLEGAFRVVAGKRVQPFLEVSARAWLAPQDVVIIRPDHTEARATLPAWEGIATAGVRVLVGREH